MQTQKTVLTVSVNIMKKNMKLQAMAIYGRHMRDHDKTNFVALTTGLRPL